MNCRKLFTLAAIGAIALSAAPALADGPTVIRGTAVRHDTSPPLRDIAIPVETLPSGIQKEIPILISPDRMQRPDVPGGIDPAWQREILEGTTTPPVMLSVDALDENDNTALGQPAVVPPDTEGDVGPDFYMQWVNLVWALFDKDSGAMTNGPFVGTSFFSGFGGPCETNNDGDPIVLYDDFAGRWVVSQFSIFTGDQCIAVSATGDPLGAYHRYQFTITPNGNNDYPKLGVWTDGAGQSGYTFTSRDFLGFNFNLGSGMFERDAMLDGLPADFFKFVHPCTGSDCVEGLLPPHLEGTTVPSSGTCPTYWAASDTNFDADGPWTVDGYRNYEICADWAGGGHTFVENSIIPSTTFNRAVGGGFDFCIDSPGESLACLSIFTMYRASTRVRNGDVVTVLNHTVDTNGADLAGVRWAELRDSGGGFTLFQDGTFAPDSNDRWMGSINMDQDGNIALGYSVSSNTLNPSIRYTARRDGDAAGMMAPEVECHAGTGAQISSSSRWGDYSTMSVDPDDDCTFWYTTEYYETTSSFNFKTRLCKFAFDDCGDGGGGGIPCSDVMNFQARCIAGGPGNRAQARVTMTDTSHDGENVTIEFDGSPNVVTINGRRALLSINGAASGPHTFELTDPAGCFAAVEVNCP